MEDCCGGGGALFVEGSDMAGRLRELYMWIMNVFYGMYEVVVVLSIIVGGGKLMRRRRVSAYIWNNAYSILKRELQL